MAKKLKKNAKNIGGTVLPSGIDLDPNNDFTLIEDNKKGQEAYYQDEQIPYLDYFGELADRETITNGGKDAYRKTSIGSFSGFGQGTLKKSYKENWNGRSQKER